MFLLTICNTFQSSCDQLCLAKSLIMKTKPNIQHQLVAHNEKDENVPANEHPKDPITEHVLEESDLTKDSFAIKPASPFDLFENVTNGSHSINDGNHGVTKNNL